MAVHDHWLKHSCHNLKFIITIHGSRLDIKTFPTLINNTLCHFTYTLQNCGITLQSERDLLEYKGKLKNMYKHPKYKFYYRGLTKRRSSLMTHLCVGRSFLNDHAFPLGFSSSPQCLCHSPRESPGHIILNCFLYSRERLTLMGKVENIIPKFCRFTEKRKLEILLFGIHPDNPDYYQQNRSLQIIVSQFLIATKRFDVQ